MKPRRTPADLFPATAEDHAALQQTPAAPSARNPAAPRTLARVECETADFTVDDATFWEIALTANIAIRNDPTLPDEDRERPARINLLGGLLSDTEGAITASAEDVERFAAVLESRRFAAAAGDDGTELTTLAGKLARELRTLAAKRETLRLSLI